MIIQLQSAINVDCDRPVGQSIWRKNLAEKSRRRTMAIQEPAFVLMQPAIIMA
jgi:hypothetical protein